MYCKAVKCFLQHLFLLPHTPLRLALKTSPSSFAPTKNHPLPHHCALSALLSGCAWQNLLYFIAYSDCACPPCRPSLPAYGFQLLGFDYMLDHELRPWLIEVNSAPSIMAEVSLGQLDLTPHKTSSARICTHAKGCYVAGSSVSSTHQHSTFFVSQSP